MSTPSISAMALQQWVEAHGLRHHEVAARVGSSRNAVTEWLNAKKRPSTPFRFRIAKMTRGKVSPLGWDEPFRVAC